MIEPTSEMVRQFQAGWEKEDRKPQQERKPGDRTRAGLAQMLNNRTCQQELRQLAASMPLWMEEEPAPLKISDW